MVSPWFHPFKKNPTGFPPQFHDLFGVFWCFLVFCCVFVVFFVVFFVVCFLLCFVVFFGVL